MKNGTIIENGQTNATEGVNRGRISKKRWKTFQNQPKFCPYRPIDHVKCLWIVMNLGRNIYECNACPYIRISRDTAVNNEDEQSVQKIGKI